MRPKEAVGFIRELIDSEKPDLLIGNSSCVPSVASEQSSSGGSFYAQMAAPVVGVPVLLGNPHFQMTEFLKQRIGEHQYKSPRKDGKQNFVIDETLINYNKSFHFPGGHTPTADEVRDWYVPLAENLLRTNLESK